MHLKTRIYGMRLSPSVMSNIPRLLAGCQSNCLQEAQGHAVMAGLGPRLD